ncbi:GNAT family N-acetyltransferase [Microterricola pindariensis]|uniref:N-acetyltransferase domain-containing protein n=1 Tax=Microterricola pindariensis TaxID=478010 RepID=A0ABX5ASB9_9MICO|nr:GNAT family N-acetyltransferase [Microterricola pindariensis]PPL15172.1 hypothetical protein GY24_14825 [Microterricola pindariensis]
MPTPSPVLIAVESPFSDDARAISARYVDDLITRYHGRPATAAEIADVDASYPGERLQEPHGLLLLARRGRSVLGCAGMRFVAEDAVPGAEGEEVAPQRVGEVTRVFVDAAARGLGLGRLLMGELEVQARAQGLSALRLDTRSDLVEARRLYAAVGYAEVAPHNDDPYADHWFRKKLGR